MTRVASCCEAPRFLLKSLDTSSLSLGVGSSWLFGRSLVAILMRSELESLPKKGASSRLEEKAIG